jgi:hypothetical protein
MTMKIDTASPPALKDKLLYVLAYLLWLVNIVVCVAAVIQLRSAATILWIALGLDHWKLGLIGQLVLLLGGLAALVYVMFLESYYRRSVAFRVRRPEGGDVSAQAQISHQGPSAQRATDPRLALLLRRFAATTAIPVGLVAASLVITEVAFLSLYAGAT